MDMVDTPKKETRDMNVMELIEKINETIKITALNLRKTNRERLNDPASATQCVQEMKNIRLLADKSKLRDAVDNIGEALRVMEMLIETSDKNVKNIEMETLISDDESLTDVSEYDSD
jgi:hypothetical protein